MTHKDKACKLFLDGCNCAQAVFTAFSDVTGIDEKTSLKLSSSFGGGIGRLREVCGACSGMFMVAGVLYGPTDNATKEERGKHYAQIQEMAEMFKEKNGSIICREILQNRSLSKGTTPTERTDDFYKSRPCLKCVADAAEIMENILNKGESL